MKSKNPPPQFHPAISTWFDSQFKNPSPPQKQGWREIAAGNNFIPRKAWRWTQLTRMPNKTLQRTRQAAAELNISIVENNTQFEKEA